MENPLEKTLKLKSLQKEAFLLSFQKEVELKIKTAKDSEKGNSDDREIAYEYNLDGRLKEITYPSGGTVEYNYDPAGRLGEVKDTTGGSTQTTAYRYNATTGFLEETERPNGVKTTYTYDGSARITDIEHRDSSNDLISLYHYEYDPGDRRRELHVTTPDAGNPGSTITRKEKYDYDELDQLIEVVYSEDDIFDANDRTVAYTYDGNGKLHSQVLQTWETGEWINYQMYTSTYNSNGDLLTVLDCKWKNKIWKKLKI